MWALTEPYKRGSLIRTAGEGQGTACYGPGRGDEDGNGGEGSV